MSTWSLIANFLVSIVKAFSETYFADRRIATEASARGRAEGAAETSTLIAETADAQAHIAADPAPDVSALVERLRQRAAADRDRRH